MLDGMYLCRVRTLILCHIGDFANMPKESGRPNTSERRAVHPVKFNAIEQNGRPCGWQRKLRRMPAVDKSCTVQTHSGATQG